MLIQCIALFCSAQMSKDPKVQKKALELAEYLAKTGRALSYGGAKGGIMGLVARRMMELGAEVYGAMPRGGLKWRERAYRAITKFVWVANMSKRKWAIFKPAQAAICLPGGFGTADELFEWITYSQLGMHNDKVFKPIGLLNIGGSFDGLIQWMDQQVIDGNITPEARSIVIHDTSIPRLIKRLEKLIENPPLTY